MLPKDPAILLSFLNTKLRDGEDTLEELCRNHGANREEVQERLKQAGYRFDERSRQFRPM